MASSSARVKFLHFEHFKSYRDSVTLGPFSDFTAVIGPNGAGKSNLMDGICFVFGVASKYLRCENLKELIYTSPHDKNKHERKAKVTLGFENEDGSVTEFSRSVDMQGTSVYRINDRVVQAAAYQQELEKLDILVKARNFLVFQGDVRAISRKTPAELTQLFEQISGSDALKAQYETAKEARDKAKQNTIFNFQKHKGYTQEKKQVKAQVEEAEKFAKLEADLELARAESATFQLYSIERKIANLTNEHAQQSEQFKQADLSMRTAGDTVAAKRKDYAQVGIEEKKLEKTLRDLEAKEMKKTGAAEISEKIVQLRKMIDTKTATLKKVKTEDAANQKTVADLNAQLTDLRAVLKDAMDEIERAAKENPELALQNQQLADYERLKEEAGTRTAAIRQEISQLTQKKETESGVLKASTAEETELRERLAQLDTKKNEILASKAEKTTALRGFQDAQEEINRELEKWGQTERETEVKRQEVKMRLDESTRAYQQLKNEKKENKRDQLLVGAIETLQRHYPGQIKGRLLDLCKPSNKKFNTAAIVALGRNVDSVVVETESVALECINYLRKERLTCATFIPLDTISVKPTAEHYRTLGKNVHLMIDCLTFDSSVRRAVQYAVGNTLVCESLDSARQLCFGGKERYKCVTLDGTVIEKNGNITGGGDMEQRGRRWEERDAEESRKQIEKFTKELKEIEVKCKSVKPKEKIQGELTGVANRIKFTKTVLENIESQLSKTDGDISAISTRLKEIEPAKARSQATLDELEAKLEKAKYEKNKVEDRIFKDFSAKIGVSSIREYEEGRLTIARERQQRLLDLNTQISRLENQLEFEKSRNQAKTIEKLAAAIEDDNAELKKQLKEEEAAKVAFEKDQAQVEVQRKALATIRGKKEELETEIKEQQKQMDAVTKAHAAKGKLVASLEAQMDAQRRLRGDILRECFLEQIKLPTTTDPVASPKKKTRRDEVLASQIQFSEQALQDMIRHSNMNLENESPQEAEAALTASSRKRAAGGGASAAAAEEDEYLDFRNLAPELRATASQQEEEAALSKLKERITQLQVEMEKLDPNMRATERFGDVQDKVRQTKEEFEKAREEAKVASDQFEAVKRERTEIFKKAFDQIAHSISEVYRALTKSPGTVNGGSAYLSLENPDEPYLGGVNYTAMPPMKRFREMDMLSGGEQTVASLALLFAIQSVRAAPFFILDEVDAALDSSNVKQVVQYIKERSKDMQFIVISLKEKFYEHANSLVGIYRNNEIDSSRSIALDLSGLPDNLNESTEINTTMNNSLNITA